jgi:hypothetical protein
MTALEIYQNALNTVSAAVLAGDFDTYAAMIDLPYLVHTKVARLLVTTRDDLRPTFQALHGLLAERRVTHYERVARAADFVAPDRIEGRHCTHQLAHGVPVAPPHMSLQTIVRRREGWRFSEAHYAIEADRWPVPADKLFPGFPVGAP